MLSPVDAHKSVAALQRAHDKGIKIIAYNDTVNAEFLVSTIASNQRQLGMSTGEMAHKYISEKMGGRAKVAVLCFDSILPTQSDARVQGFLTTVTHGLPGVQLKVRKDGWVADKAIAVAAEILKTNPDVDLIFAANEGGRWVPNWQSRIPVWPTK
ncbi:MAG: substrate-binding domain-containing protein [Rhodocyclaceae bacterium]|nr:substrate-binding domain-containing protein [Rhodocyclaceae bacterium]